MKIEVSETVAVDPAELFEVLTDFESHLKHWARGVLEVKRPASAKPAPATDYLITGRNFGLNARVRWDYTITACEPPHRFAGEARGGPLPFSEEFHLTEVPGGTRITLVQDLQPAGQFRLTGPLFSAAWPK